MNKEKLHEFDLVIYPCKLWIAISTSKFEDIIKDASEFRPQSLAQVETVNSKDNKVGILIRFLNKKQMNHDIITHESVHSALDIFNYIGAEISADYQEPFAYLAGYIAKCCEEVKNFKEVKNE